MVGTNATGKCTGVEVSVEKEVCLRKGEIWFLHIGDVLQKDHLLKQAFRINELVTEGSKTTFSRATLPCLTPGDVTFTCEVWLRNKMLGHHDSGNGRRV